MPDPGSPPHRGEGGGTRGQKDSGARTKPRRSGTSREDRGDPGGEHQRSSGVSDRGVYDPATGRTGESGGRERAGFFGD